jgi:hypothetical protein
VVEEGQVGLRRLSSSNSANTNGTHRTIMPAMSRLRRSSFATTMGHFKLAPLVDSYAPQWPQFEGVNALAGFDLDMLAHELEPLKLSDASDRPALGVEVEARAALSVGRDAKVGKHLAS